MARGGPLARMRATTDGNPSKTIGKRPGKIEQNQHRGSLKLEGVSQPRRPLETIISQRGHRYQVKKVLNFPRFALDLLDEHMYDHVHEFGFHACC